jgi:hypothetical protein
MIYGTTISTAKFDDKKERRKEKIIEIMKGDEELGLYDEISESLKEVIKINNKEIDKPNLKDILKEDG